MPAPRPLSLGPQPGLPAGALGVRRRGGGEWQSASPQAAPLTTHHSPRTSPLAFGLFLLVNATLFLRPAEVWPAMRGLPIYQVLILASAVLSFGELRRRLGWRALKRQPIAVCVLGLLAAVVLSHLSHANLYEARIAAAGFFKTLLYFLLFVALVTTPERLRGFLATFCGCVTVMVSLCVADYLGLYDFQFIQHVLDRHGVELTGEAHRTFRMRGTGIFQDPNDLAMLIVATLVLCAYLRGDRRGGAMRWGWLGATALLAAGLFCTQSRGGLLAAGLAGVTFLALRYGKTAAVLAGALGAAGLALLSGRQTEIDLEGGTGRERLLLWRDGFEAIQSPEALFGIGYDAYADMAGLVAHNSFIHAFVELGLFGGTLFFGGFFFAALGLWRLRAALSVEQSRAVSARTGAARPGSVSELIRFHPYLAAVLAGWCGGMLSLSRCYVAPTYMVLGLAAVSLGMAGRSLAPPRLLVWWDARHVKQLLAASAGCLVSFYLVVKVLAH